MKKLSVGSHPIDSSVGISRQIHLRAVALLKRRVKVAAIPMVD